MARNILLKRYYDEFNGNDYLDYLMARNLWRHSVRTVWAFRDLRFGHAWKPLENDYSSRGTRGGSVIFRWQGSPKIPLLQNLIWFNKSSSGRKRPSSGLLPARVSVTFWPPKKWTRIDLWKILNTLNRWLFSKSIESLLKWISHYTLHNIRLKVSFPSSLNQGRSKLLHSIAFIRILWTPDKGY